MQQPKNNITLAHGRYDQINEELSTFMTRKYGLTPEDVTVAVIGLRLRSEVRQGALVVAHHPTPTVQYLTLLLLGIRSMMTMRALPLISSQRRRRLRRTRLETPS